MPARTYFSIVVVLLNFGFGFKIQAQSSKFITGTINGQVKDSSDLSNLPMATIAVYKAKDTSLIKYQLADARGRFRVESLPLDTGLILIVSYMGYRFHATKIKIGFTQTELSVSNILLAPSVFGLKEVIIRPAPITMRGDTVEFLADAFKSRENAVIGDLMRSLPGFIVWADGKITVNGKPVNQVLVEGKVFFFNDARVALNNIPKDAVDKIQVIPEKKDVQSILLGDTAIKFVKLNLTLKKGYKSGMFGKASLGLGSNGRRDVGFSIALFTPKDQITVNASTNNINRAALSGESILINNSFRNPFANDLDLPNFTGSGIINQQVAGLLHNRDWSKKIKSAIEYNLNINDRDIRSDILENTLLSGSSTKRSSFTNTDDHTVQNSYRGMFSYRDSIYNNFSINFDGNTSNSQRKSSDSTINTSSNGFLNKSVGNSNGSFFFDIQHLKLEYKHYLPNVSRSRLELGSFDVRYDFNSKNSRTNETRSSYFTSPAATLSRFDREYSRNDLTQSHVLNLTFHNLREMFRIRKAATTMEFATEINYDNNRNGANVNDFDPLSSTYTKKNLNLSNADKLDQVFFRPRLNYKRSLINGVSGQYQTTVMINATAKEQIFSRRNSSNITNRNIDQNYSDFLPQLIISYSRSRISKDETSVNISYQSTSDIPEISQLAPLVDSISQYQYYLGNRYLKNTYNHSIELSYNWKQQQAEGYNFSVSNRVNITERFISDSTYFNSDGRRIIYPVNVNGYSDWNINATLKKAFKLNTNLFNWTITTDFTRTRTPLFIDGVGEVSTSNALTARAEIGYTKGNGFNVKLLSWYSTDNSKISANSSPYRTSTIGNSLLGGIEWPKRFFVNTSANFTFNRFGDLANTNLIIWNTSMSYRLSKKEQFEIKLAVNDILNQSQSIRNYVSANTIGIRHTNNLQQFMMVSLAYYPRVFGGNK